MPFDNRTHSPPTTQNGLPARPVVALWLFALCAMILVMIVLGGATRLTGSGLSIMEWAPILGTMPPLSDAEWQRLFALYQRIPQYQIVNQGFGIEGFKSIFWLEWTHRFWGRLMGLVLTVPLVVFWARGLISRALGLRLAGLLVLGGLQGAVGWFMVASGFEADSVAVSPYRLVIHLALALTLYAALLWTALGQLGPAGARGPAWLRPASLGLLTLVALTILAGGFVAGLKAGLTYNTFPLMDGQLVPDGWGELHPLLRNLTENIAAVQFDHRLLATLTALTALAVAGLAWRGAAGARTRAALAALAICVLAQYALGVTTLLLAVPVGIATAHQAVAILVLTAALMLRHAQRAPT